MLLKRSSQPRLQLTRLARRSQRLAVLNLLQVVMTLTSWLTNRVAVCPHPVCQHKLQLSRLSNLKQPHQHLLIHSEEEVVGLSLQLLSNR